VRPASEAVAIFCGGRGAASLVRSLLRTPGVRLTLLVNAYDDGLSTGALREYVPGMLGASDFRKNLARLIELSSPARFAVMDILEHRLPAETTPAQVEALAARLRSIASGRRTPPAHDLEPGLASLLARLDRQAAATFADELESFHTFAGASPAPFAYGGCAIGNLLLAGAYLSNGRSFNRAIADITRALMCRARLLNVSDGENRVLVALKEDGEILERESRIVGPQSDVPIRRLFLLRRPLSAGEVRDLQAAGPAEAERRLLALHADVAVAHEAAAAIEEADTIVYAPGTLHSSLLPSYLTRGVPAAIARSRARRRVFVANLCEDHDTQGLGPAELLARTLAALGDPLNERRSVTHVLVHAPAGAPVPVLPAELLGGAVVVAGDLANPVQPCVHSGSRVASALLDLRRRDAPSLPRELDIHVDVLSRTTAAEAVLQDVVEQDWTRVAGVRVTFDTVVQVPDLPPGVDVVTARTRGEFSETAAFVAWLAAGESRVFASITGDGDYRLCDVMVALGLLREGRFGVVLGARNQSRYQLFGSLSEAYAGRVAYAAALLGGFGAAALCAVRFGVMLSDPLTGFRVCDRAAIPPSLRDDLLARPPRTPTELTRRMVSAGIEVAEIPVVYSFYPGFTDGRRRLRRGLQSALGLLR
jgi:2-phospho-L-lactate transferase/gluconeogenesis factor (CofD/UPF0052 family)